MQVKNDHSIESYFHSFHRGEAWGFNYFFKTHNVPLIYFAQGLVNEESVAEDIVEECFIKLWQYREKILHPQAIKSFLYTSVRNACVDQLRKLKRAKVYANFVESSGEYFESSIVPKIIESEIIKEVYLAMEKLPLKIGRVFRMHFLEGKDYNQIAKELHVSIQTVRNQKARAIALIRKQLPNTLLLTFIFLLI
ncbi:MAG: RNA polymerase sigma-70 factor [Flavisolibacter sp.]